MGLLAHQSSSRCRIVAPRVSKGTGAERRQHGINNLDRRLQRTRCLFAPRDIISQDL